MSKQMDDFDKWVGYVNGKCEEYFRGDISQATMLVVIEAAAGKMRLISIKTVNDAMASANPEEPE